MKTIMPAGATNRRRVLTAPAIISYTVIQLVCYVRLTRPFGWGSRGRWFKSSRPDLCSMRWSILRLAGLYRSIPPHSIPW